MAQHVVLQSWSGNIGSGVNTLRAGDVIDDTAYPVSDLMLDGASIVPLEDGMLPWIALFKAQARSNDPSLQLLPVLRSAGFLGGGSGGGWNETVETPLRIVGAYRSDTGGLSSALPGASVFAMNPGAPIPAAPGNAADTLSVFVVGDASALGGAKEGITVFVTAADFTSARATLAIGRNAGGQALLSMTAQDSTGQVTIAKSGADLNLTTPTGRVQANGAFVGVQVASVAQANPRTLNTATEDPFTGWGAAIANTIPTANVGADGTTVPEGTYLVSVNVSTESVGSGPPPPKAQIRVSVDDVAVSDCPYAVSLTQDSEPASLSLANIMVVTSGTQKINFVHSGDASGNWNSAAAMMTIIRVG